MNWDAAGAIAEIVGAIAVVITLLYLARQVQQNTKTERIGTAQQILSTGARMNAVHAQNSELLEVLTKIRADEELTPREHARYGAFLASIFSQHWQVHYQFHQGSLDDEIFRAYERRMQAMLTPTINLNWWNTNKFRYGTAYQQYVDKLAQPGA
jgi:hypothetical protein